jgi:NAD(P)-dependent dehydrogenase (short-subunit alcohol dehydrogenase family)
VFCNALAAVFEQSAWEVSLLGSGDPSEAIKRTQRQRGRIDAWIYVPPVDLGASGSISDDPVLAFEAGCEAVRGIAAFQPSGAAVVAYVSLDGVSVGLGSPRQTSVHAALLASVRALGVAWAQQSIRVNAILSPLGSGFANVHPTRYSLRRLATPEDLAWPAVFLSSSEASYVTAEALRVDGGFLCYQYF